jgi:hypothetical protein
VRRAHQRRRREPQHPWWARRTPRLPSLRSGAIAFAHPTRPLTYSIGKQPIASSEITKSQKYLTPCSQSSGQGIALISLFRLPRDRGGWRADKALPGLLQAGAWQACAPRTGRACCDVTRTRRGPSSARRSLTRGQGRRNLVENLHRAKLRTGPGERAKDKYFQNVNGGSGCGFSATPRKKII